MTWTGCSSVTVSGCDISTGDDAIAIKSDIDELGYHKICEKITVSNCRLRTSSCGIRVGYEGDGELRDCVFQDNVIYQSMIGISIMSVLDPENPRGTLIRHGAWIHDITFSDMAIDAEQTFNLQHLKMGGDVLSGKISRFICEPGRRRHTGELHRRTGVTGRSKIWISVISI